MFQLFNNLNRLSLRPWTTANYSYVSRSFLECLGTVHPGNAKLFWDSVSKEARVVGRLHHNMQGFLFVNFVLNTFDQLRDVNKYLNIFDIEALWSPFVTKGNLKKTLIGDILLRDVKNIKIALTVTDVQRKFNVLWGAAGSLCHTVKRLCKCTFIHFLFSYIRQIIFCSRDSFTKL